MKGNIFPHAPILENSLGTSAQSARDRLISTAESYLGTPYRFQGLSRQGLDCSGLIYVSFRDALNIPVPRSSEQLYAWTQKISPVELKPGDLVFFNTTGRGISHVGIYVGLGSFIHSASQGDLTGVIFSQLGENYYARTFVGVGRALPEAMPGVD
jgi:probable lipoprotein NlpC